jgi:hypothetical protein
MLYVSQDFWIPGWGGSHIPGIYTRNMRQVATYWEFAVVDGYGQSTFAPPIQIACRWQDQAVLFRNAQGQEMTSQSIVYPAASLTLKGYLKLGTDDTENPIGLIGAFEIQQIGQSPSLDAKKVLYKVYL